MEREGGGVLKVGREEWVTKMGGEWTGEWGNDGMNRDDRWGMGMKDGGIRNEENKKLGGVC